MCVCVWGGGGVVFPCVALAIRRSSSGSTPSVRNTFGVLVCVICNSKRFYSFIFMLCILIVHILTMCISILLHFMNISHIEQ